VICNSSFDSAGSGFGQVDCTIVSYLREHGLASKNSDPHITKDEYPGAYVQPPIPGIYDHITDFDFTSLYPSIIMTYNIGVNNYVMKTKDSTVGYNLTYHPEKLEAEIDVIIDPMFKAKKGKIKKEDLLNKIKENNLIHTINGCFFKTHKDEMSVYSLVLENLLSARRAYKKKMLDAKESEDKATSDFYDTKQMVYKILANTLYGVVANQAFRFFNTDCAAAVTLSGQEALKASIIESDAFVEHLYSRNKIERPPELTKREMYSDKMPNRQPRFIIAGDTDSVFVCFQEFPGKKTDEEIKVWCDQIQNYLNNDIIKPIVKRHNVSLEFNKLDLKNELIISRGLFLAKKRYVIHVVNNEGRKVDEMKYMGLEIKRRDFPSHSKKFLKELIERIIKTKTVSISSLLKFVESQEKEFIKLIKKGSKTIARPVSYGKSIDKYKVVPQAVRAMEAFNQISYRAHTVGSMGYLFHVNGIDTDKAPNDIIKNYDKFLREGKKLTVVGIPDEELFLPSYYIPNVKAQLKFTFIDRYELLLAPITEVNKSEGILSI
jgi:DNA polymerase elongation subunit (family B)